MYERNAIVIDRHFANLFGYNLTNNLKNNSKNYFELVSKLEEYQIASENENNVMMEFERVANQIRETQKLQEIFNKRNQKYCENRKNLFDNLDEDSEALRKKFEKIEEDIRKNDEEIKTNVDKFVEEVREFTEKTQTRTDCGRERRIIENDYQKILKTTTENFEKINKERLKEIKAFVKQENKTEEKEKIKEEILKNGSKEKVPFDENVINKAIDVSTDIEQKKVEILMSVFDKTGKLLDEIKNDNIKIERHKKIVRDAKSKLEYLNVIGEYVVLFLDNERMNTIGGKEEHERIMSEACDNVQQDLIEIQGMYSLLIKEITDKSSKKAYKELYNLGYLFDLQEAEEKFETNISKLNFAGTVIYPEHWRIEGLQKIYDTFKDLVTNVYGKDLSEYEPLDIKADISEDIQKLEDDAIEAENDENLISEDEEITDNTENENIEEDSKEEVEAKQEEEKEEQEAEDDFEWDDDEIDDELNFDKESVFDDDEYLDDDDDEEEIEEEETFDEDSEVESSEEQSNDKDVKQDEEIDKILGFFDDEESLEEDDEEIDFDDLDEDEEEDINIDDEDSEDDKLEEEKNNKKEENEEEEHKEKNKKGKKKMSLFGRRRKD